MVLEELIGLVARGESEAVEFKETTGQRVEACHTLCAFLNGNGGVVVFGVTKKDKLVGQLVSDETRKNLAAEFVKFEPGYEFPVEYVGIDDTHQAIVVHVPAGKARPYQYDGKAYRRVQSTTRAMPQQQYESLLKERGGFRSTWESVPNGDLSIEALDAELICETARMGVAYGRLDAMADVTDPQRLLRKFGLMKDGRIFNGAAVLFGKDFVDYPQCYLRMARFDGIDKREFVDSRNVQGNLFTLANEAVAFCFKHLNLRGKTHSRILRDEALEVPVDALREAVVNALAHRDYANPGGSASIAIFDDRVEISNPGSFPPEFPLDSPEKSDDSFPHNPVMARVLYLRKTIETWGRGMNLIFSSCRDEGREPPSVAEGNGSVKLVFRRAKSPNKADEKSPNKVTGKSPNKLSRKAVKSRVPKLGTSEKSHNKKGVTSDNKPTADVPNKTSLRNRTVRAFSKSLPAGMRIDARRSLIAVFKEILSNREVTIVQLEEKTSLANGTVKDALAMLKEMGAIFRVGARKNGHWLISSRLVSGQLSVDSGQNGENRVFKKEEAE